MVGGGFGVEGGMTGAGERRARVQGHMVGRLAKLRQISIFLLYLLPSPNSVRRVQDAGRTKDQWVTVGFNPVSVIFFGTLGLSVTHATD